MKTIAYVSMSLLACVAPACGSGGGEGLRVVVDPDYRLLRLDLPPPESAGQALTSGPAWGRGGPRAFSLDGALARAEARLGAAPRDLRPAPLLQSATVELSLRPAERNLSGRAVIGVVPSGAELASLRLALDAQAVDAVNAQDPAATFTHADGVLTVTPATPLPAGQLWTLEVLWHDGEIEHYIDAFEEGGGRVLANLLHPTSTYFTYGYRYFPDPMDTVTTAAAWTFQVTFPADRRLVMAGAREAVADNPDGTRTESWSFSRARLAAVPLALAAYERVDASCGPVALEIYGIPGTSLDGYPIAPATYGPVVAGLCARLTERYDEPFADTIRLVGVDERFSSGVAFRGLILVPNYTWDDDGSGSFPRRDFYLAHELTHQWWTGAMAAQARDLWLIEGTADLAAVDAAAARGGAGLAELLWLWEVEPLLGLYRLGEPETPLVPEAGVSVDPRITYVKGAWALRMLEDVAGPEVVAGGLRTLRELHRDTPFTTEDFTALLDGLAGQDLGWFHAQWLHGLGLIDLAEAHEEAGASLRIEVTQRRAWADGPARYFRAPLTLRAELEGRSATQAFQLDGLDPTQLFELPRP